MVSSLACSFNAGAVLDITLMANVQSPSYTSFYLSCVTGERNVSLQIVRDNKIVMAPPRSKFQMYKNNSQEVQMRGFSLADLVGIMYCSGRTQTEETRVVYVHNNMNGKQKGERNMVSTKSFWSLYDEASLR